MDNEKQAGIGFFEKYLTVWVILCMVAGVLIGRFLPAIPSFLQKFEYAKVSIPIAVLIWLMIYPMMMKVDFESIREMAGPATRHRGAGRNDWRLEFFRVGGGRGDSGVRRIISRSVGDDSRSAGRGSSNAGTR